jgi:P27 family predicted phage terminase small subunit
MRGPKPTPTHLKILRGNPGQRRLHPEVEPAAAADIPDPPGFLTSDAKVEWRRIVTELYRLGLLTLVDERPFAAYCQAYGRWVAAEKAIARMAEGDPLNHGLMIKSDTGNTIKNPLVGIASQSAAEMVKYAAEFGFTPAARARIAAGVASGSVKSKFAGLIGGSEADAGRKAARGARYQVHRNADGAEWEGPGEAVQAGDVPEKLDSGHLRAAPERAPGGAPSDPVHRPEKWQDGVDRGAGASTLGRTGSDSER